MQYKLFHAVIINFFLPRLSQMAKPWLLTQINIAIKNIWQLCFFLFIDSKNRFPFKFVEVHFGFCFVSSLIVMENPPYKKCAVCNSNAVKLWNILETKKWLTILWRSLKWCECKVIANRTNESRILFCLSNNIVLT